MRFSQFAAAIPLLAGADAFWRMECRGRVGIARIDPMVSPGEVAQHVHSIHGSSGFSESATYDDLIAADCTSCAVTSDKSVYWTPSLYFQHENGSFELVPQTGGMLAYYKLDADSSKPDEAIQPFPPGFRMIAGDSLRRNYSIDGLDYTKPDPEKSFWSQLDQTSQDDLAQRALGFNCLNYDKDPEGAMYRHYLPDKDYLDANCANGVRFEIAFPGCWDGTNLDSKNHRSHVAYPDLVNIGSCPADYPVRLPGLFYETIWETDVFNGTPGTFVISNGDVQGFGYHADFMMGWESGVLEAAVQQCTNLSGTIEDCPVFQGKIQDEATQGQCKLAKALPAKIQSEVVEGIVGDSLPGNVKIQYGPAPATQTNPASQTTTVAVPTVSYSPAASSSTIPAGVFRELGSSEAAAAPTPSATVASVDSSSVAAAPTSDAPIATPVVSTSDAGPTSSTSAVSIDAPGPNEVSAATQTPTVASSEAPAPTEAAILPPIDDNLPIVSTQWITNGNVVSEVVWKEQVVYVTESKTLTVVTTLPATSSVQAVRRVRRSGHLHRHRHDIHGRR